MFVVFVFALILSACSVVPPTQDATTAATTNSTGSTPPQPTTAGTPETYKFTWPNAGVNNGNGWSISGLPTTVDSKTVLVTTGMFKNTIGLGTESWLAEPGTFLAGPEYPQSKIDASAGSVERISPITQKLIDHDGEFFHLNEDRFDLCSFGGATLEFNGAQAQFDYQDGHNYILVIRGLFPDGKQDTDRNHSILFNKVIGSHAQCMSYPQNKGGFLSEGNFLQVVELSHKNASNCGAEGCSKLTVIFVDVNTGALTVITQANLNQPWKLEVSNWKK